MITKLYMIYDRKSLLYHPPAFCHNAGHALRHFTVIFEQPNTMFSSFPGDFQVWESGEFDDQTGLITPLKQPHLICECSELSRHEPPEPGVRKGSRDDHPGLMAAKS